MSSKGIVFDIREFTVHDGPGIRTTVFMKGCPLRCQWCHNPEGLSAVPQTMKSPLGGRSVGVEYSSEALAQLINNQSEILRANEGGVTFSGGEPLAQADFVSDVIDRLQNVHVVLDTSGYASDADFRSVAGKVDMVYFDLKIMDTASHIKYTGVDNTPVLRNLTTLAGLNTPFHVRVPLVPGVTDTNDNLSAIAATVEGMSGLVSVDLLNYNRAAGAKYEACGLEFSPSYNETESCNGNTKPFLLRGIKVRLL